MKVCVIDDGSSQIKLLSTDGSSSLKFPSVVENRPVYSADGISKSTYAVDGLEYTVLRSSDAPERTDTDNYQTGHLNRVLVHEALREAGLGGQDVALGVTLPIGQYFELGQDGRPNTKRIEAKKANLKGPIENRAGETLANIQEVYVFPEALPAAVDVMTDLKDGELVYKPQYSENLRVCCIDVGGHSIDIVVFESQTGNILQQEGFNGGVIRLVDALQNKLMGLLGESRPIERSIAERAMIQGQYAGHNLKATITQIANPLAEKVKATLERITSKRSTDLFLIVGGGADLVKDKVIEFAGEEKTLVPVNPDESIARGVSKMLLARLKKNPVPAKKSGKKEIEA